MLDKLGAAETEYIYFEYDHYNIEN